MSNAKENATLKEIADRLGLNVGTVSRALNGSPRVREETRRLVVEAASQLNYRPNKSARNLVRGKPQNRFIAILMPNIVHQFFLGALKGIIDELSNASFNVMVFTLRGNRSDVIDRILDEAPDGLLVFAKELTAPECAAMEKKRIPYLYIDYLSERRPCVYFDNYLGGQLAARHLLGRNVRSPLYVGLTAQSQQQELRFRGFSDVLADAGIVSFEAKYIPRNEDLATEIAREVLSAQSHDGIFFYCDELAYGGLRAFKETGRSVPMIGYDDLHISDLLGLTTVRQDAELMGKSGALRIMEMLQDPGRFADSAREDLGQAGAHVKLDPVLVVRSS
jgi:DNA-binding LacI/PurR family transcriptional regulator